MPPGCELEPEVFAKVREFQANCENGRAKKTSLSRRIFLLSPASITGIRGALVMKESSDLAIAQRLRQEGVTLGELFSFMSGLYFRGKLAYAKAFANAPANLGGAFVITASGGLIGPETHISLEHLKAICACDVDPAESRYRAPLDRDMRRIADAAGNSCEIVLLGSIATPKYVGPLRAILGKRLVFPAEFVGRGDMSRGGLMLRCVQSGKELTYVPVLDAVRHGTKPPKLQPLTRSARPSLLVPTEN